MSGVPGLLLALGGFVLVIGPLVFLHELGHYFAGRWCGVQADSFSIGMGREVFGWTDRRGTRWKLSALPIGGYVKFAGDMGPAGRSDPDWIALPPDLKARTFQAKALWQRVLIVAAGPIANFLVAIAIFAGFFAVYGVPFTPPVVREVIPRSAAEQAGVRPGDRIEAVAGRRVETFQDLASMVLLRPGERLILAVERGGRQLAIPVVPAAVTETDRFGNTFRRGLLGVVPGDQQAVRLGPAGVVRAAVAHTFDTVRTMTDVLGQIISGRRPASELGGPIQIARFSGQQVQLGPLAVIEFMALISINLGFINLLPIPMLDGGHLFFYAIEAVRRRPLPDRAQDWAFRSGLALLLGFMLFVTVNDLGSLGLWRTLAGLIG